MEGHVVFIALKAKLGELHRLRADLLVDSRQHFQARHVLHSRGSDLQKGVHLKGRLKVKGFFLHLVNIGNHCELYTKVNEEGVSSRLRFIIGDGLGFLRTVSITADPHGVYPREKHSPAHDQGIECHCTELALLVRSLVDYYPKYLQLGCVPTHLLLQSANVVY